MVSATRPPIAGHPVAVRVWGDYACFSRPEYPSEKVSYPVMTPTAAKGLLEAIFWKPQFEWQVVAIDVLKPVRWTTIFRNGIGSRQTMRAASAWLREGGGYDAAADRKQYRSLLLRDVDYVIHAFPRVVLGEDDPAKYRNQFRRRVGRGQFFSAPYLGCREHLAHFTEPDGTQPIEESFEVGPVPAWFRRDDDDGAAGVGSITSVEWLDAAVTAGRMIVTGAFR